MIEQSELLKLSKSSTTEFLNLLNLEHQDKENKVEGRWKLCKTTDTVKVYSVTVGGATIHKTELAINKPPEHVFSLIRHNSKYRGSWDLHHEKIIEKQAIKDKDIYILHHLLKQQLKIVSARDSVDVATFGKNKQYYFVAAQSLPDSSSVEPVKNSVRVNLYPSGYAIRKIPGEPDKCVFVSILHADLKLNVVGNFLVEMVKPQMLAVTVSGMADFTSKMNLNKDEIFDVGKLTSYPDKSE